VFRAIALAVAVLTATPAQAQRPDDIASVLGSYGGSFTCEGREHGFFLTLASLTPREDGGHDAAGVIGLFPILSGLDDRGAAPAGSFTAIGTLGPDGALSMTRVDWLFQALGYGAPNLEGRLAIRTFGGFDIRGRVVFDDNRRTCSDMLATKFMPPAALPAEPQ